MNSADRRVFELVRQHLMAQGARSITDSNSKRCLFRGTNHLKCAVGALIPDEEYEPSMEIRISSTIFIYGDGTSYGFLDKLMDIHDKMPVDLWELELERIRASYV